MLSRTIIRQYNFWVIRQIWGICKANRYDVDYSLYDNIGITRGRYTRALDGKNIRLSDTELNRLYERTGINIDYFTGKKKFSINGINEKDIENYCNYRSKSSADFNAYNTAEKKLKRCLKQEISNSENFAMKSIVQYATLLHPEPATNNKDRLKHLMQRLNETLTFSFLNECDVETLRFLVRQLNHYHDNADTVLRYKQFKEQ